MRNARSLMLSAALVLCGGATGASPPATPVPAPAVSASAAASAPRFSSLPLQREDSAPAGLSLATQLVLAAVLLAVLAAVYKLRQRKLMVGGSSGALHAGAALRLTPATSLHVVHWGSEELLVATTASSVSLLARRPPAAGEPAPGGSA